MNSKEILLSKITGNIDVLNGLLKIFSDNDDLETVKILVELGADIHYHNDSVLCSAASSGYLDLVEFCIEKNADSNVQGGNPLKMAVLHGHFDIVKKLVECGADIHTTGELPIMWAI